MSLKASGSIYIDALAASSWGPAGTPAVLTYSFLKTAPTDYAADDLTGFKAMSAVQQSAVNNALATWAAVANVTFVQVATGGDIRIGTSDQGDDSNGYAYRPDGDNYSVYLFTNNTASVNTVPSQGGYGYLTLIHEIGHTLGLKHPGDYGAGTGTNKGPFLPDEFDDMDYTVMSYNDGEGYTITYKYAVTPMMLDILAIQYMYGANMSYHAGNDIYRFTDYSAPQTIWDAGGIDTLDFSATTQSNYINLNDGSFSETGPSLVNVALAFDVSIEKVIAGSGGAYIVANSLGNTITGGAGNDHIYEGAGNDTISSGGGSDTVVFYGDLSGFTLSGTSSALTAVGHGTDQLKGITTLEFDDRTIDLAGFAKLQGGSSADNVFTAVAGNELVTGGAGFDVDKYSGKRTDFTVKASGNEFTVTDKAGSGGTDLLSNVERVLFSDGSAVALDVDGFAGQVYRLYQAAFNRQPDQGGVGFWLNALDHGLSLYQVAQYFIDSPESARNYGTLDDKAFVTLMYANVLHRAPDAGGLKFYLDGFATGGFTRTGVLVGFSESPENQAAIIGSITNGVDYIPVA